MTRPLFLKRRSVWPRILGLLSLSLACLGGGYWVGKTKASSDLVDALQSTCGRAGTLMQFPDGSVAACGPIRMQPELENKFSTALDKLV